MIQTSTLYNLAVKSGTRSSDALVTFVAEDVTANGDATPTANESQPFTSVLSIIDGIKKPDFKMATFEDDYFKLDGSFYLAPDDVSSSDNLGWWSESMSDSLCGFVTDPVVTIDFAEYHSSLGLVLSFGTEEYCTDFTIVWYDGITVLDTSVVTGNTQSEFTIDNHIENYNKIEISFQKTRNPYRYARLNDVLFGLEELFTNDNIISASITEEVDPSSGVLSINTMKITLLNEDQKFNMLNPQGVYAFLQKRQKFIANSGLLLSDGTYEFVPLGTFYLSDWKNATGLTATLEATDAIGLLDKSSYYSSPFWVNEPIANVISHILSDAGSFQFTVSAAIATQVINGYVPIQSHRKALHDVLVSAMAMLRMGRSNVFEIIEQDYVSAVDEIRNDVIIGSPAIEQRQLITGVNIDEYTYALDSGTSELYNSTFTLLDEETMVIPFGKAASSPTISVTGLGTIVGDPIFSSVAVEVTISGTGELTILVEGIAYLETKRTLTVNSDVLLAGEIPQTATIGDNKLIVGNGRNVANHFLDYFGKRIKQSINYWDNPAIQAGDVVDIETAFSQFSSGIIEKHEITFAPNLKGRIEVVG